MLANDRVIKGDRVIDLETGLDAITGAHMHLCHINSVSLSDIKQTMALVEEAQAKGINITTEAYPFDAAMFSGPDWRSKMDSTAGTFQLGADRMTVADLATFENANPLTLGVQTVIVNGGFSVRDGKLVLDAPNGRQIRDSRIE